MGSTTLFKAVFIKPKQVARFYACTNMYCFILLLHTCFIPSQINSFFIQVTLTSHTENEDYVLSQPRPRTFYFALIICLAIDLSQPAKQLLPAE